MTKELSIIPREILLPQFLGCVNQLIKQAKEVYVRSIFNYIYHSRRLVKLNFILITAL